MSENTQKMTLDQLGAMAAKARNGNYHLDVEGFTHTATPRVVAAMVATIEAQARFIGALMNPELPDDELGRRARALFISRQDIRAALGGDNDV